MNPRIGIGIAVLLLAGVGAYLASPRSDDPAAPAPEPEPPTEVVGAAAIERVEALDPVPTESDPIPDAGQGALEGSGIDPATAAGSRALPGPVVRAGTYVPDPDEPPLNEPQARTERDPRLPDPPEGRIQGTYDPDAPDNSPQARFRSAMASHYERALRDIRECLYDANPAMQATVTAEVIVADYGDERVRVGPILGDIPGGARRCIEESLQTLPMPEAHEGVTHRTDGYTVRADSSIEFSWQIRAEVGG